MYRKILVPLDGSKFAESALEHVRAIAQGRLVDKVVLIRVLIPIIMDAKDYLGAERVREAEDKLEADAKEYLDKTATDLRKEGIPVETKIVVDGEPAAKILEVAREERVDLIIMSTHGRSGFTRWIFGSVANRVLIHSSVPVLMVVPEGRGKEKF
ncbi:MAG: universal stress protein [Spirochaetota bacterium]